MIFTKIYYFFRNPIVCIVLLIIFITMFFVYNYLTNKNANNFFSFGPTKDHNGNPVSFLGNELLTWTNVILAYLLIFLTSLFSNYYTTVMNYNIFAFVNNKFIKKILYNKHLIYFITLFDPILTTLLYIIQFYATATFQIQYIIPQFLGLYVIKLPVILKLLSSKTFI